jgi:hypothetical protein
MNPALLLKSNSKNEKKAALRLLKILEKRAQRNSSFLPGTSKLKNVRKPWSKFYKVFKNDTSIIMVSANDFKVFQPTLLKIKAACAANSREHPAFPLPDEGLIFYGYLSQITAMEHAKAGALKYISKLIDEGEKSHQLLLEYREAHYDDLNINLIEGNIRRMESLLEVS